jgi:hypothetical protein
MNRGLDAWGWIFAILGALCVVNALWMLAGPLHWCDSSRLEGLASPGHSSSVTAIGATESESSPLGP